MAIREFPEGAVRGRMPPGNPDMMETWARTVGKSSDQQAANRLVFFLKARFLTVCVCVCTRTLPAEGKDEGSRVTAPVSLTNHRRWSSPFSHCSDPLQWLPGGPLTALLVAEPLLGSAVGTAPGRNVTTGFMPSCHEVHEQPTCKCGL